MYTEVCEPSVLPSILTTQTPHKPRDWSTRSASHPHRWSLVVGGIAFYGPSGGLGKCSVETGCVTPPTTVCPVVDNPHNPVLTWRVCGLRNGGFSHCPRHAPPAYSNWFHRKRHERTELLNAPPKQKEALALRNAAFSCRVLRGDACNNRHNLQSEFSSARRPSLLQVGPGIWRVAQRPGGILQVLLLPDEQLLPAPREGRARVAPAPRRVFELLEVLSRIQPKPRQILYRHLW